MLSCIQRASPAVLCLRDGQKFEHRGLKPPKVRNEANSPCKRLFYRRTGVVGGCTRRSVSPRSAVYCKGFKMKRAVARAAGLTTRDKVMILNTAEECWRLGRRSLKWTPQQSKWLR